MSFPLRVPRAMAERKPAHGEPCNGCGVCCYTSLCKLAQAVFKRPELPGPCPALRAGSATEARCAVVQNPRAFAPDSSATDVELRNTALLVIGAGYGCDARINGEPINHAFNRRLEARDSDLAVELQRARILWGVKP